MGPTQQHIIADLQVAPAIDAPSEIRRRVGFLAEYLQATGLGGYVLGISGGQDSTLAGWLAQRAAQELRAQGGQATFVALRLAYGRQQDEDDARRALEFIGPDEVLTLDVAPPTDALVQGLGAEGLAVGDFNKGNIKARQRMVAHYAVAGERHLAVLGSDHAAEAVTGFFTKFGDGAADVMPLHGLTKRQGRALLAAGGCPPELYEKIPTADLLDEDPGQSDEEALGVTYEEIDDYLEGKAVESAAAARIEHLYRVSRHKRLPPVRPQDQWWREGS